MGQVFEDSICQTYRPLGAATLFWKRTFDLAVAGISLIVLAPVFGLIALLIKLDSRGPVFFRQVRVGRHRRRFLMWKFRKMHDNLPTQGPNLTRRYDTRMTRLGRILERTKLDELPQLLNVLTGEMSVVGPRPEVPPFVEYFPSQWDQILSVKPGIVGPCQVQFRNESEMYPAGCRDLEKYYVGHILPAKLAIDAEYASRPGLAVDTIIFVRALLAAFFGVVTRQTLANRRWQILNTLILSFMGLLGTAVSIRLLGHSLDAETAWRIFLCSVLVKPACLIVFRIPKALASSITADDLIRCCWCAAVSGSLTGCAVIFAEFRGIGRSVLLADGAFFLAVLVLYKLACYNAYMCFIQQRSRGLVQFLILISFILSPLSMALVLAVRHGATAWAESQVMTLTALVLLAGLVRPAILLFNTGPLRGGTRPQPLKEWGRLALGAAVGSTLIVSGALLLNERGIGRLDVICDGVLYLSAMSVVVWWRLRRDPHSTAADAVLGAARERLLIVGDGADLGGYIGALSSLPEHQFEIVGALSTRGGFRTNTAGGVPVLGEIADAPEVVRAMGVTRLVVLDTGMGDAELDDLLADCALSKDQILRLEVLAPLRQLFRADLPAADDLGADVGGQFTALGQGGLWSQPYQPGPTPAGLSANGGQCKT